MEYYQKHFLNIVAFTMKIPLSSKFTFLCIMVALRVAVEIMASTVMSGKFGLASGKSQGNVREFCLAKSV